MRRRQPSIRFASSIKCSDNPGSNHVGPRSVGTLKSVELVRVRATKDSENNWQRVFDCHENVISLHDVLFSSLNERRFDVGHKKKDNANSLPR